MRRSAQIISGHNYYRKANEILRIDQQRTNSFGVLDELKNMSDNVSILGLSGFRLLRGGDYVSDQQIETSKGGLIFRVPSVSLENEIVIQPNIAFTGDFSFEFDISVSASGIGQSLGFYLYPQAPFTQYYVKAHFEYLDGYKFGYNTPSLGGLSTLDAASTKLRLVRAGTLITASSYKPSSWKTLMSGVNSTIASTMYFLFFYTTLTSANYVEVEYKNFVLNSGQTQVLW